MYNILTILQLHGQGAFKIASKSDLFFKNSTSQFFMQLIHHKDVQTFTKLHLRNLYPFKDN